MARRLIGLDVGTHAVTLAAVSPGAPPRLDLFGQVTLARDAMREGEVVDDAAVTDAVGRLREQLKLGKAPVRLGIASPRLIVRQVDMPVMSREELAGAIRFQAADLIPIPIDEAVLDFAILETAASSDGEPVMRVLLAAAQQLGVMRLVGAVEAAGLPVDAVDLMPLALIRALAHPEFTGAEGIVSFGGGVTSIAVHDAGVPRFIRVLGTGGRELTDAIAAELEIPHETAESLKRQLGTATDELSTRASAALERPLGVMLEEVRSSIDYYRNQPGAAPLARVVVTGGASALPGIPSRLANLTGLTVEVARPRDLLAVGDIGFDPADYSRLDPNLAAAAGLALGGLGVGIPLDLLPQRRRSGVSTERSKLVAVGAAAAVGLLVLLGVPTFAQRAQLSDKKDARAEAEASNAAAQQRIDELSDEAADAGQVATLRNEIDTLLASDVAWSDILTQISHTIPSDVWLTSFSGSLEGAGSVTPPGGTSSGPPAEAGATSTAPAIQLGGISGSLSWQAQGRDYNSIVAWIDKISKEKRFSDLWVSSAQRGSGSNVVEFESTATLTDAAKSERSAHYTGGDK